MLALANLLVGPRGASVQVTINSKAQLAAYQGLEQTLAGKTINGVQQVGGVVALNPSTGAILAMASYPSYNPTVFDTPFSNATWNALDHTTPAPLFDYAIDQGWATENLVKRVKPPRSSSGTRACSLSTASARSGPSISRLTAGASTSRSPRRRRGGCSRRA